MPWQRGIWGHLEISLYGEDPERVINMAMSRGIYIWDIRQLAKGSFLLKIRIGGYKALRHLVRRSGCRMRVTRKKGLIFYLWRVRKRKALAAGLLFFCVTLYILSSFVWFIEIRGNIKVETGAIEQNLRAYGLKAGMLKSRLNDDKIKDRLLLDMPELAWAGIRVRGSKVIVEVAEKTLPPADDEAKPADIVARIGGKVEEVLVLKGVPRIEAGEKVEEGQVLVEGLAYPQILRDESGRVLPGGEAEIIRARALVRARIERKGTGACFLREEKYTDTGAETKVLLLRFRGQEIVITGPRTVPYERYRALSHVKKLPLGRICRWPVELITVVYLEQKQEIYEWGLAGAYQEALARGRNAVYEELPDDYRITREEHRPLFSGQADLVTVEYELETIEDIAAYRLRP